MEVDSVSNELQHEEEYVLLDLDSVSSQFEIPENAPYVLSGLDTMHPVLIIDDKLKLVGEWEETIGTCLIFREGSSPVSHEETGPSEANLFAGKCIVDQNVYQCKQVNPLGCAYRRLKFRLAPDCDSHGSASIEAEKV
ncbi:PREDICTED: general transcription factor 3C polypeptide 6-like isoform X2 [Fragaria vesca subsp. vesca]|uniref:general transcription factor 3C polypeptide 6-like isoform X2 n=1 Tax=Fragaria vesca subsp. vesca TaxID=101020 RepID=UPI0002C34C59|nr:PREDICTED: general transcription factor 3C polypeptide 6-like isoform X2 [Fragaria vesca subsp. vesca]